MQQKKKLYMTQRGRKGERERKRERKKGRE